VYTTEFKAEAVALAEKHEKAVSPVAADLDINEPPFIFLLSL
jgi:transposase-like protein